MENQNVRMILCDVDGTLLPKGQESISCSTLAAIRKATEQGIQFVIASGRSYQDLEALFRSVKDMVSFICGDGALAMQNGKILYQSYIEKETISFLLSKIAVCKYAALILYGTKQTYCLGQCKLHTDYVQIASIDEINEPIYKICFFNLSKCEEPRIQNLAVSSGKLEKVYADASWTEFVSFGTDKGVAAKALQTLWKISPMETAAFGDNINDFGMLRQARLSYASPTAISEIRRMAKFTTNNVTNEILNIVEKGEHYE